MPTYVISRGVYRLTRNARLGGFTLHVPRPVQLLYRLPVHLCLCPNAFTTAAKTERTALAMRRLVLTLARLHAKSAPRETTTRICREILALLRPHARLRRRFSDGMRSLTESTPLRPASATRGVFVRTGAFVNLHVPSPLQRLFRFPSELYLTYSRANARVAATVHRPQLLAVADALLRGEHDTAVRLAVACLSYMPLSGRVSKLVGRERLCAQVAGWARRRQAYVPTKTESYILTSLRHAGPAMTATVADRLRPYWLARKILAGGSRKKIALAATDLAAAALRNLSAVGLVRCSRKKWRVTYPGPPLPFIRLPENAISVLRKAPVEQSAMT